MAEKLSKRQRSQVKQLHFVDGVGEGGREREASKNEQKKQENIEAVLC